MNWRCKRFLSASRRSSGIAFSWHWRNNRNNEARLRCVKTLQRYETCSSFLRTLAFCLKACLQWKMPSPWKRAQYRLEWIGLLLAAKLIPLLSRKVCLGLARTLGTVTSISDRQHRKVALSNLEV